MIRIWGTGYPYPPLDLPPGRIFRYEGGWDVWGPAWGDVRLWTFAITEKEPAIVTGTDVRLAPWNSGLFLEAGRLATVIGGGGMRGSSSRVTA